MISTNSINSWDTIFFNQLEKKLEGIETSLFSSETKSTEVLSSFIQKGDFSSEISLIKEKEESLLSSRLDAIEMVASSAVESRVGQELEDGSLLNQRSFSLLHLNMEDFQFRLDSYNKKIFCLAAAILNKEVPELKESEHICLATTGSDGRGEKLSLHSSPVELILIVKQVKDLDDPLIRKVNKVLAQYSFFFDFELEIKCLERDSLIGYNQNKDLKGPPNYRPFPTRALDAKHLMGSNLIMAEYRTRFFAELKEKSSAGSLKKFHSDAVKFTLRGVKRAVEKDRTHFDLINGELHYDGKRVKATKYLLLRAMQYQIASFICKRVNKGQMNQEELASLPSGVIERIQWLADKQLLKGDRQQVGNLKTAYAASLIWFGNAQRLFETEHKQTCFVPKDELAQVTQTILNFSLN